MVRFATFFFIALSFCIGVFWGHEIGRLNTDGSHYISSAGRNATLHSRDNQVNLRSQLGRSAAVSVSGTIQNQNVTQRSEKKQLGARSQLWSEPVFVPSTMLENQRMTTPPPESPPQSFSNGATTPEVTAGVLNPVDKSDRSEQSAVKRDIGELVQPKAPCPNRDDPVPSLRQATYGPYNLDPPRCGVSPEIQRPFQSIYSRGVWSGTKIGSLQPSTFYSYSDPARWKTRVSSSGDGSNTGNPTKAALKFVVDVIREHRVETMLDLPCGDVNWMMEAFETDSLPLYVGGDITPSVLDLNRHRFRHHRNKQFVAWDLTTCPMPRVVDTASNCSAPFDLIHVRDVLQHLPLARGKIAAQHLLNSGARLLISTTFPTNANRDIRPGDYFQNNLLKPPFSFPEPVRCVPTHPASENDKTCLWRLR